MATHGDRVMDALLNDLMEKAELQGYLLTDEIFEAMPDGPELADRLEEIVRHFQEAGIDVYAAKTAPDDQAVFDDLEMEFDEDEDDFNGLFDDDEMDIATVGTDDTVGLYLKEMTRVPLLSCKEEVRIAKQIVKGREALQRLNQNIKNRQRRERLQSQVQQGIEAREHLIKANTRLVVSIAKRYMGQGVPFLDLIQEGNLGLMKAVEKYDYKRGFRFST